MIYLDHAATSPILPCAKQAMLECLDIFPGNPSALHTLGHLAKNQIETARKHIAALINASPEEIIFTSGGSEANNTIISTFRDQIIAHSPIEHPSILQPAAKYAKKIITLPVNAAGIIATDRSYRSDLCSIMLANNEIGTIEPIKDITAARLSGFYHSDLTQALGKIPIDVKELDLDYATLTSHKIGGPTGVGALYIKKGSPFTPLILGGEQEHGLRAGTYNTAAIVGFGAAAKYAITHDTPKLYRTQVLPLRNLLADQILSKIPYSKINTPLDCNLPNILNVSFDAAEGESIQLYLDLKKQIAVSTGSACASSNAAPSHVIMAIKNDAEAAHSSIRFSLGLDTTKSDIDEVISILPDIIHNLRSISTISPHGGDL